MSSLGIAIQSIEGDPYFLVKSGYINTQNYIELLKQFNEEMKQRRIVVGTFSCYNTMMLRPEDAICSGTCNSLILNNSVRLTYTVLGDFYVIVFDTPESNPFHSINMVKDVERFMRDASKDFKLSDLRQRYSRVHLGLTRILYGISGSDILSGDITDVSITKRSMKDTIEQGLFENNRLLYETKKNPSDFNDLELLFQISISFSNDDHKTIDLLPVNFAPKLSTAYDFNYPPKPAPKVVEVVKPKIIEAPKLVIKEKPKKKVENEDVDEEDEPPVSTKIKTGSKGFTSGFDAEEDEGGFAAEVDEEDVGDAFGAGGDTGFGDDAEEGFGGGDNGFGDDAEEGFGGDDGFGGGNSDAFGGDALAPGDSGFGTTMNFGKGSVSDLFLSTSNLNAAFDTANTGGFGGDIFGGGGDTGFGGDDLGGDPFLSMTKPEFTISPIVKETMKVKYIFIIIIALYKINLHNYY